ncbi:9034_t:CDS:2, partial [Paraglomus occultum]
PYEHEYTVYHKLASQPAYSKRGELRVIPSMAVAQYVDAKNALYVNKGEDEIYFIKIVDNENTEQSYLSFTKLCLLWASKFEDEIIIHLDSSNNLYHFDYYTAVDHCNGTEMDDARFKTTVQTIKSIPGPRPKLHGPVPVAEDGTVIGPPPEKSFIQKYWVYILPLILIMLVNSAPPEEGREGQGGQSGQGGNRPARG